MEPTGREHFVGDIVAAVERYTDIPEPLRAELKKRMASREFGVRRDRDHPVETISGERRCANEIRDMRFGAGMWCRTVTRPKCREDAVERGLVRCERGHCIVFHARAEHGRAVEGDDGGLAAAGDSFDALAALPSVTLAKLAAVLALMPFAPPSAGGGAGSLRPSPDNGSSWGITAGSDGPVINPSAPQGVGG